jgi:hypothetical protein
MQSIQSERKDKVDWAKIIVKELGKLGTFAEAESHARKIGIEVTTKRWRLLRRELFGEV